MEKCYESAVQQRPVYNFFCRTGGLSGSISSAIFPGSFHFYTYVRHTGSRFALWLCCTDVVDCVDEEYCCTSQQLQTVRDWDANEGLPLKVSSSERLV